MRLLKIFILFMNLLVLSDVFSAGKSSVSSSSSSGSAPSSPLSEEEKNKIQEIITLDSYIGLQNQYDLESLFLRILRRLLYKTNEKKINEALKLLINNFKNKINLNKIIEPNQVVNPLPQFPIESIENEELLKLFFEAGADLNQQDTEGNTLLLRQLLFKVIPPMNLTLIEFLLRNGANPNIANKNETFLTILEKGPSRHNFHNMIIADELFQKRKKFFADVKNLYDKIQKEKEDIRNAILEKTPLPMELAKLTTEYLDIPKSEPSLQKQ